MSIKRLFPERGTYDLTTSISELQQRCNDLTSVITSTTDSPTGAYNTAIEVQPQRITPPTTSSSSPVPPMSSPMPMMHNPAYMHHVDAIVQIEPTSNIGFHAFEMDQRSQRSQKTDRDTISNASNGSKCENCMVNCLYYSNECCDCTIL